jgi:hypothetical protein
MAFRTETPYRELFERLLFTAFPDICLVGVYSVSWWRDDETTYDCVRLAKLAALNAPRMLECAALIEEEQACGSMLA